MSRGAAKRPTKAEHEQRIAEVVELLLTRVNKQAIVRFGAQRWNVGARAMEKYMVKARAQIRARASFDFESEFAKALCSYELIYAKLVAKGDLRGARQTLDRMVELLGVSGEQLRAKELMSDLDRYLAHLKGAPPQLGETGTE